MGCCGGRKASRRVTPKPEIVEGTEMILLAYTGTKDKLFSIRGPKTNTKYFFSAQETDCQQMVYIEDVEGITRLRDFGLADATS
jgi:hypothetical protein